MSAFWYGVALQWRLDIRSRTMLITCYVVPLLFFAIMGGIFTSILPEATDTLIPSMTVMGVSMGALIGLPPERVYALIEKHGVTRVMFGSDYPLRTTRSAYDALMKLPFTDAEREQILLKTAADLFGV